MTASLTVPGATEGSLGGHPAATTPAAVPASRKMPSTTMPGMEEPTINAQTLRPRQITTEKPTPATRADTTGHNGGFRGGPLDDTFLARQDSVLSIAIMPAVGLIFILVLISLVLIARSQRVSDFEYLSICLELANFQNHSGLDLKSSKNKWEN